MEKEIIKSSVPIANKATIQDFLAVDFGKFNFRFLGSAATKINQDKLIEKYKNLSNVLILFNGKIIANTINNNVVLATQDYAKENLVYKNANRDFLEEINYQNLNSYLSLTALKNCADKLEVNIVIAADKNLAHYSNYVVCENTNVTINEFFEISEKAKLNYFATGHTSDYACLNINSVQMLNNKTDNSIAQYFKAGKDSCLNLNVVNLNTANTINQNLVDIIGQNAVTSVNTATIANNNTNLATLVKIVHLSQNTESMINNVGVVNDTARFSIDGIGRIEQGFCKSIAMQESRIVNLTDTANSVANPQLIINEFDVKAGHAAAVGRIDEDQLYYLMSRGLSKKEARELLVLAYLNEILEKFESNVKLQEIKDTVKEKIS